MLVAYESLLSVDPASYTREHLLAARCYVLDCTKTARQGGFGQVCGRMVRETVGYKFDNMPIDGVLLAMEGAGFLERYRAQCEKWFGGLNKSATDGTLKRNEALYKAAIALADKARDFAILVRALRIICHRNQDWREKGNNLDLTMNGHKALLDLFSINVTRNRRAHLTVDAK